MTIESTLNACIERATYSPDDNKLRMYPTARLDLEDFNRIKDAGYRWAPKQELFFCPRWTPKAEDLALEWAGSIEDEDTTLAERAEVRAERFGDYSDKRDADGDAAAAGVAAITEHIPLGQPILVGHHSQRHAERDAQRIESGMRKAVKMWETSEYWTQRAAGAIAHAKYLERPEVRARRIKKLEANRRKKVADYTPIEKYGVFMQKPWTCPICGKTYCEEHPEAEQECEHVMTGQGRAASPVREAALPRIEKGWARWIAHIDNRLSYEKAMLENEGASHLLDKPKRPKLPPILNFEVAEGEPLSSENQYHRGQIIPYVQHSVTKEEWKEITRWSDAGGTRYAVDKSYRFRVTSAHRIPGYKRPEGDSTAQYNAGHSLVAVFISDQKAHPRPVVEVLEDA